MVNARLLFVHVLSPLHAGTGQGVGVIDLPVARERATGLPYLPGSSLKGVLRDTCTDRTTRKKVFGPDTTDAAEHAGSVQFSDQRLLLLPVRSLAGTFAWVTSPYVLHRLVRDVQSIKKEVSLPGIPSPADIETCFVADSGCRITVNNQVILEDLDLKATLYKDAGLWAEWIGTRVFPGEKSGSSLPRASEWLEMLIARICVVHDDVMSFLLDSATEITARIRLREDAKTVAKGGLWYEEALPTETILSGLVVSFPVQAAGNEVFETLSGLMGRPLQFGGKATVGRGLCRLQMTKLEHQ